MYKMNALFAGNVMLILLAFVIYLLSLATRLVKAVEKIANQPKNIE
jgi:hypothetical protein